MCQTPAHNKEKGLRHEVQSLFLHFTRKSGIIIHQDKRKNEDQRREKGEENSGSDRRRDEVCIYRLWLRRVLRKGCLIQPPGLM